MLHYEDGKIVDDSGKVVFFDVDGFVRDVCESDVCFYCGRSWSAVRESVEHVIPRWILRSHGLYNAKIKLPNGTLISYRDYTVPCCETCNGYLNQTLEQPVREILEGGIETVNAHLKTEGPWLFLRWLALVFLKTHLKDRQLRLERDRRKPDHKIDALYDWATLHHAYTLARAEYAGAKVENSAMTTCLALPVGEAVLGTAFDYLDSYDSQVALVRHGHVALIGVFNDGCVCTWFAGDILKRAAFPLHPMVLREVFARVVYMNSRITNRPEYGSSIDPKTGDYTIEAKVPIAVENNEWIDSEFGRIMYFYEMELIEAFPEAERESIKRKVLSGLGSFIGGDEDIADRSPEST